MGCLEQLPGGVCSGNGVCTIEDRCECSPGYTGRGDLIYNPGYDCPINEAGLDGLHGFNAALAAICLVFVVVRLVRRVIKLRERWNRIGGGANSPHHHHHNQPLIIQPQNPPSQHQRTAFGVGGAQLLSSPADRYRTMNNDPTSRNTALHSEFATTTTRAFLATGGGGGGGGAFNFTTVLPRFRPFSYQRVLVGWPNRYMVLASLALIGQTLLYVVRIATRETIGHNIVPTLLWMFWIIPGTVASSDLGYQSLNAYVKMGSLSELSRRQMTTIRNNGHRLIIASTCFNLTMCVLPPMIYIGTSSNRDDTDGSPLQTILAMILLLSYGIGLAVTSLITQIINIWVIRVLQTEVDSAAAGTTTAALRAAAAAAAASNANTIAGGTAPSPGLVSAPTTNGTSSTAAAAAAAAVTPTTVAAPTVIAVAPRATSRPVSPMAGALPAPVISPGSIVTPLRVTVQPIRTFSSDGGDGGTRTGTGDGGKSAATTPAAAATAVVASTATTAPTGASAGGGGGGAGGVGAPTPHHAVSRPMDDIKAVILRLMGVNRVQRLAVLPQPVLLILTALWPYLRSRASFVLPVSTIGVAIIFAVRTVTLDSPIVAPNANTAAAAAAGGGGGRGAPTPHGGGGGGGGGAAVLASPRAAPSQLQQTQPPVSGGVPAAPSSTSTTGTGHNMSLQLPVVRSGTIMVQPRSSPSAAAAATTTAGAGPFHSPLSGARVITAPAS